MLVLLLICIQNMVVANINPEEGDIIYFWSNSAQKNKFAINLEPKRIHKHKPTFNGVLTTTRRVEDLYPCDHRLSEGYFDYPTKAICDQPQAIQKGIAAGIRGKISDEDLENIRKKVADSLGIPYSDTTN